MVAWVYGEDTANAIVLTSGDQFSVFLRYSVLGSDSTVFKIKENGGKVVTQGRFYPAEDYGYKDMVATLSALVRMPDSVDNPVYFTGGLSTDLDTGTLELAAAAKIHTTVPHASPDPVKFEVEQGVHIVE